MAKWRRKPTTDSCRASRSRPIFFFKHEQSNISELAFNLATEPWEFSPNWEARHSLPLQNQPMPEFNFDQDTKYSLRIFKVKKLGKLLDSLTQDTQL